MYTSTSCRPKRNNSSTTYIYTTTSNPSTTSSSYIYTTTSTFSSSTPSYTYSTTSTTSPSTTLSSLDEIHNEPYRFTVTSDYYKNLPSSKSTSEPFSETYSSSSVKKQREKKECLICAESRVVKQFPKITEYCSHSNDICKICVSKHIETQLNTKGDIEGILCPLGENCGSLIGYNDVQRIVEPDLFEQ